MFLDFYAPWCIWCQRIEPVLAKLGQELGKQGPIYVGRLDCTLRENEQACISQHVHSFPTLMFYRHGDEHPFEAYNGERTVDVSCLAGRIEGVFCWGWGWWWWCCWYLF